MQRSTVALKRPATADARRFPLRPGLGGNEGQTLAVVGGDVTPASDAVGGPREVVARRPRAGGPARAVGAQCRTLHRRDAEAAAADGAVFVDG